MRKKVIFGLVFLISLGVLITGKTIETAAVVSRPTYANLNFYYGDLHAHSGYSSDGVGRPEDAYDSAKDNGNDFFALTEHDEAFVDNPYLCVDGVNNADAGSGYFKCAVKENIGPVQKWENVKNIASQKTVNGQFVGFYGFEWTHTGGHVNVFEAPTFINPPYTLDSFYGYIDQHPNKNVLFAMFNHPYPGFDFRLPVGSSDPNTIFTYRETIAPYARLVETNNFASNFPKALKKGYKVGAAGYGDGHSAEGAGSRRYGILASSLDKNSLTIAIKNRQTFAVLEGRAGSAYYPLAIGLKVNNKMMGGTVLFNGTISYEVYVRDDLKNIEAVELRYGGYDYSVDYYSFASFANNGREKTLTGTFSDFMYDMPGRARFVYAVAKERDANNNLIEVAWSSPVWINYDPNYGISPTATPTRVLVPTSTPSPISSLSCQSTCYYGKAQCVARAIPAPGGKCLEGVNPNCSARGEWSWSYCTGSVVIRPTATPTRVLVPTATPSPISSLSCQTGCFFGKSQCVAKTTTLTGGSCKINPACKGSPDDNYASYWRWAYCR